MSEENLADATYDEAASRVEVGAKAFGLSENQVLYVKRLYAGRKSILKRGDTILHIVCADGDLQVLKYLVKHLLEPVDVLNRHGETPLLVACKTGRYDIVKYLVESADADVFDADAKGSRPVDVARDLVLQKHQERKEDDEADYSKVVEFLEAIDQEYDSQVAILDANIERYLRQIDKHQKEFARLTGSTQKDQSPNETAQAPATMPSLGHSKTRKDVLKEFEDRVVFVQGQVRLAQQGNRRAKRVLRDMDPIYALRVVWEEICKDFKLDEMCEGEKSTEKMKTNRTFLSPLPLQTGSHDKDFDGDRKSKFGHL